jgi:hypothetical protein
MLKQPKVSAEELQWRAESDAHALKRAQEIMGDNSRLKMAQGYIQKELTAIQNVAKSVGVKATTAKSPAKATAKKTTTKKTTTKGGRK